MLVKSNSEDEKKLINELIESDEKLRLQHTVFVSEMEFKQKLIDARKVTPSAHT